MPGYIMHLAVAGELVQKCRIDDINYINEFKLGNVVPDAVGRSDKKLSHFWDDETYKRFVRKPNLEMFLDKYGARLGEPYVFGYFCHLYLDCRFIDTYWNKHFEFLDSKMDSETDFDRVAKVHLIDNDKIYDRTEFFSDRLYYGDYDRLNSYMIKRYNVTFDKLVEPKDVIEEISVAASKKFIEERMKEIYNASAGEDIKESINMEITGELSDIKVFDVEDLNRLIADTSEELSRYFQNVPMLFQVF